jgi:hypothetical protein
MDFQKIKLRKNSEKNIIYVIAIEYPKSENIINTAKEVLSYKNKHQCNLVLLDGRESKSLPSIIDMVIMGKQLLALEGIKELKTAIVSSEAIKPGTKFFSNFARNRGYSFKAFLDIKSAEDWLTG